MPFLPPKTSVWTATGNWFLLAICLVLPMACAEDPKLLAWDRDFQWTERLFLDGQHALAVGRYKALRKTASDPRDADEAGLMQCEVERVAKRYAASAACSDALGQTAHDPAVRMRAILHAGEVRYDYLDRKDQALTLWTMLVERAPEEAATLRALDHLTLHARTSPEARTQMLALMQQLHDRDPRGEMADNLLLRMAMLRDETGTPEDRALAIPLLERLERDHRYDSTLVDSLVLRASLQQKAGNLRQEAIALEHLVDLYETSYVFASYGYEPQKAAAARLIVLYRGPLKDLERALYHAEHLPDMLRRPVKMPAYMQTVAEIQEEMGRPRQALQTWQDILRYVAARNAGYKDNDRRICRELGDDAQTATCLREVEAMSEVETRESAVARSNIVRLQAMLAGGTSDRSTGTSP
jgi:tetratricopeptide (TPR) repeat protein